MIETGRNEIVGGAGGFGFGGFGGGGILEGIILASLLGKRGGLGGGDDGCAATVALTAAIASAKDTTVAEGRFLGGAICDAEKTNLQQFFAAQVSQSNGVQAVKDQATAFAIVADKRFDDLTLSGVTQTAAILARINQTEVDSLRDRLNERTREVDASRIEINNINTNTNVLTAIQAIAVDADRKFNFLAGQIAKSSQDIISVGSILSGVSQTANPVNVKS